MRWSRAWAATALLTGKRKYQQNTNRRKKLDAGQFKSLRSLCWRSAGPADSVSFKLLRSFYEKHFMWPALSSAVPFQQCSPCWLEVLGSQTMVCTAPCLPRGGWGMCLHVQGSLTWSTTPLWLFQWLFSPLILCTEGEVFRVTLPKFAKLCSTYVSKNQWI